jgi:type 1 glutamine amidotransferase
MVLMVPKSLAWLFSLLATISAVANPWVVYEPKDGTARGKHIVLLAGDEEYRSEEGLPMLGKILSQRHGFKCSVLFAQDLDGTINPNNSTNVPGMHLLDSADLVVLQFRFRELPDADMKHFVDYLQSGKPLIAIRTATHSFQYQRKDSRYAKWDWRNKEWPGGFGQQVLGDTWVSHHGVHGKESTRGLIDGRHASHPVLRGVKDVWGPSDVYGITHLKPEDTVLLHGLVIKGMKPDDLPNYEKSVMPLVWVRDYRWDNGKTTRALTSTLGAATDLQSEDLRRLFVNACYWLTDLDVPAKADVACVGDFQPSFFGFGTFKKGVKVSEHELK